jgi:3-hydroxyisobutyrate dehydrogenase-like beta-hydroxyacid dehydrogenase
VTGTAGAPSGPPGSLRAGFIGLGSQGGGMARRQIACGIPTTLWARRPEVLAAFPGAAVAATPAELAAASDVVSICVVDDDGVDAVLGGPDGVLAGLAPGAVVAVHSTVHPDSCRRWADELAAVGASLLDAPVSGGGAVAEEGRLLVLVGGEPDAVERARPALATYGDPVVHLGPVGAGQLAKLVNNVVFTAHLALAEDALALARGLGLDALALLDVLQRGSGASFAASVVVRQGSGLLMRDIAGPLLRKDVSIIDALAASVGAPVGALVDVADRLLALMGHERSAAAAVPVTPDR